MPSYELIENDGAYPIKAWTVGVPVEEGARRQLENISRLPFIHRWVAAMPDVHWGIGATVGSVIPTVKAIIPAAVGVDIGCGMMAVKTSLVATDLPDDLKPLRDHIENAVPVGRAGHSSISKAVGRVWSRLGPCFEEIRRAHPRVEREARVKQLGSLGGGNHFIEVCLDETDSVWIVLHSGSRGVGNAIGTYFIELARDDMGHRVHNLPDRDLAYFDEGTEHFADYVTAVDWAQDYARQNRELMMDAILKAFARSRSLPAFTADAMVVNCHHNYVQRETHYGREVWVTRKGAVRAGEGELGIIPGSMGARSYIVRGRGNPESFLSCSHGAGRLMSRTRAKKVFSLADHEKATRGVECRKDAGVLDETPGAYKPIEAVMAAQHDLVAIVHTLRQVVCVKG